MERHRRVRRSTLATALGAALAVSVFAPSLAGGDVVGDVLNTVGVGGGSADNRAGVPPDYKPPLHGTNPHGQGSVAVIDIDPGASNPYPAEPQANGEIVVVGDSRGEQNGSSYRGEVTLLYLAGQPFVQADSNPGETDSGPVDPAALNAVCAATSGGLCVNVLTMNSTTSSTGSNNSFQAAGVNSFGVVDVSVAESSGNINESGGCQTATGSSSLADVDLGGNDVLDLMPASSTSTSCNNGTQSQTNNSSVGFPLSLLLDPGCGSGDANTNTLVVPGIGGIVCNATDSNAGQTGSPYGVREALSAVFTIPALFGIRIVVSGPESHAVAPPAAPTTPAAGGPAGKKKKGGPGDEGEGGAAGAVAGEAAPGEGVLAFTGQNLLILVVIGAGLLAMGLATSARKRRIA